MPLESITHHVYPEVPAEQLITITCILPNKIAIERFCPTLNEWILMNEFIENDIGPRFTATFFNNEIVLLGGYSFRRDQKATNHVISINLNTMKRRTLAPTLVYRHSACAAVVEGILYYLGGRDLYANFLDEVECWDPKIGKWDFVAPMAWPRSHFAVAVLDGRLYAGGGFYEGSSSNTMEYYYPKTNTWYTCAPMNYRRSCLDLAVLNNFIYAVGGYDQPYNLRSVERYDPNTNTWMQVCSINVRRSYLAVVGIAGHLWAIGGRTESSLGDNTIEEYDPATNAWSVSIPKIVCGRCFALLAKNYREI